MKETVCVYVPTYNSEKKLKDLLDIITQYKSLYDELLVVDGCSQDQTTLLAAKYGATIIHNSKRHVAAARKLAVEKSQSDIIISIDSDCIPSYNWLNQMLEHFSDRDLVGVGGPYTCNNPKNSVEEFSAKVFERIMLFPKERTYLTSVKMAGTLVEGNCAFRRKYLLEIGNYQEKFTNHAEGVDIVWRLVKERKKILFDPNLKVDHLGYPDTIKRLISRNYHFGWSSTKLAKFTIKKNKIDWKLYIKLVKKMLIAILGSKESFYSLIQLGSFIYGKMISSLKLRCINL